MAGVPHHALPQYLSRLVNERFVVALAEQLEPPRPNKLVRREVVRIVTPGTLIEDQLLDGKQNNYLAAISAVDDTFGIAYADVSTGYCAATALSGEDAYESLLGELGRVSPAEVVADLSPALRTALSGAMENGVRVTAPVLSAVEQRERRPLSGFSLDESLAMHRALDALIGFVRRTGVASTEYDALDIPPLRAADFYRRQTFLALDRNTRKNLELTHALGANPKATLLGTLDKTATSMGSRLLARWILAPLMDRCKIEERQGFVQALMSEHGRRQSLQ